MKEAAEPSVVMALFINETQKQRQQEASLLLRILVFLSGSDSEGSFCQVSNIIVDSVEQLFGVASCKMHEGREPSQRCCKRNNTHKSDRWGDGGGENGAEDSGRRGHCCLICALAGSRTLKL